MRITDFFNLKRNLRVIAKLPRIIGNLTRLNPQLAASLHMSKMEDITLLGTSQEEFRVPRKKTESTS